MEVEASFDL